MDEALRALEDGLIHDLLADITKPNPIPGAPLDTTAELEMLMNTLLEHLR